MIDDTYTDLFNKIDNHLKDIPHLTTWYFPNAEEYSTGTPVISSDGYFEVFLEFRTVGGMKPLKISLNRFYL